MVGISIYRAIYLIIYSHKKQLCHKCCSLSILLRATAYNFDCFLSDFYMNGKKIDKKTENIFSFGK